MQTEKELQDEILMFRRKLRTTENLLQYIKADSYSVRRRNHFLVIANRIYMTAIILIIILFFVLLLLL